MDIGKILILLGAFLVILGGVYLLFPTISFPPKLPGDIFVKRGNFTFYFPVMTSIILSIILSLIFFFLRK